jgi:Ca2+/Na+ antiporter
MMALIFALLGFIAGLLLVSAGFAHLIDPNQGRRFLGQLRVVMVIFLVALVLGALEKAADRVVLLLAMLVLPLVAYFVREYRKPKREKRFSSSGIERNPILPPVEPRSEGEEEEQAK